MRQMHTLLLLPQGGLLIVIFIIVSQVIVNDIFVVMLTGLHHPKDGREASVQGREVGLGQERGNARERILGQRLSHDITQTEVRGGQEVQAKEGGATDPVHASEAQEVVTHVPLSPIHWLNYLMQLLNAIFNNTSVLKL